MMTKRRILRAGLWVLALAVLLIGAGGGLALSLHHKFNPDPPRSDFPVPANALEARQQDIEQFSRLLAMDRSFSAAARAEAQRQIAGLKAERLPRDSGRFRVALMSIAALADNGHTSIELNQDTWPNYVPLRVMWFADGLYVLRAKSPYADRSARASTTSTAGRPLRCWRR
jgi:hypothetical protein